MKPTDKQIQEFWELCGLTYTEDDTTFTEWRTTSGELVCCGHTNKCPPIDLNNIFKYAVPKVRKICGVTKVSFSYFEDTVVCSLMGGGGALQELFRSGLEQNEEDALFWAIYKALGGK